MQTRRTRSTIQTRTSFALLLFFFAFALLPLRQAVGQTSADGTIHGHIVDSSGAILPGVRIVAHIPAVGGTFKATSDAEGNYRLIQLPTGTDYTVEAEFTGFTKFLCTGLVVRAGLNVTLGIALNVGSENQTVQVSGDAPLIDTQSSEQAVNLSGELLRNVPINGQHDWSDSLQLTPGTPPTSRITSTAAERMACGLSRSGTAASPRACSSPVTTRAATAVPMPSAASTASRRLTSTPRPLSPLAAPPPGFKVATMHAWNYAPRVGGAYVLTRNQKNVVRASWT